MTQTTHRSIVLSLLSALIALTGLCFAAGGVWLGLLGGSWYYAASGAALLLTAALLVAARPLALWLYAAILAATAGWSLWEVGLDWWGLAARGDVLLVVGLLLVTPSVARRLRRVVSGSGRGDYRPGWRGGRLVLGVVLVLYLGLAGASWFVDPYATEGRLAAAAAPAAAAPNAPDGGQIPAGEWHVGRTAAGQRYSPLDQIVPDNVNKLEVAWTFHTGDQRGQPGDPPETTFEVTPLKIGSRLYLCTPHQLVIALDATSGKEIWRFDPEIEGELALQHLTCRGLSYQPAPAGNAADANPTAAAGACAAKLFMPTADGRLIALNPEDGSRCAGFGDNGQISLWTGMPNVRPGAYYSTSPVVVTRELVIVGGTVLDNVSTQEASGVIRAYDIASGRLVWNWDSGKPEQTAPIGPGETYTPNSPNSWTIMSVDENLGLVYVPLGNQPPDQWGGRRSDAVERYSSSIVALDIASGQLRWVFQTVHHDLWDYDVPAQPSLIDLTIKGARAPALVQPTKQGELFVLDRRTGTPLLPVTEVPAPQGAAAGDHTAPTQPVSAISFNHPPLTGAKMWGATPFDQLYCRVAFHRLRYEGRFTPPTTRGSLIYPGNFGVFNWGGVAVDPERQVAFTTPTYLAFVSRLVPRPDNTSLMVQQGGQAPPGSLPALNENFGAPFAVQLHPFTSPLGIPCQEPPWGYVAGVDLASGAIVWQHRNGTIEDLSPLPLSFRMGVPTLGGPLLTRGGVAFLSGTLDDYVRAYDVSSGHQLWESRLPAGGQATPMSYLGEDGRQYVLVVAGGHGSLGTKAGDAVVAYALPKG
ncbi:MAG: membrane-bound PQQ-dependent dehydrogenase, glucose/quinate/shikimate family [Propionivibrio sp.]